MSDITIKRHRGNNFSREANASLRHVKGIQLEQVLACIKLSRNGLIAEEVGTKLGLRMASVSARMTELKADGLITHTGEKRQTTSGRNAGVWRAV